MTPREFLEHFGSAIVRVVPLGLSPAELCVRNPDRYAVWFWGPTVAIEVRPSGGNPVSTATKNIIIGGDLLITHHEHLSIVNLGWEAFTMAGAGEIHVIEAMMPPASTPRRRGRG